MTYKQENAIVPPRKGDGRNHETPDTACVRITDAEGRVFRLVCQLGDFSVWREPTEKCLFRYNIGRMMAVVRDAARGRSLAFERMEELRALKPEERRVIFRQAMEVEEHRFFSSIRASVEKAGGWRRLLGIAGDMFDAHGTAAPWTFPCMTSRGRPLL